MGIKKIIDDIIDAETPDDNPATCEDERAIVTNDPDDAGGRTQFGISEKTNPQAWADGRVTEAEARSIYERKYVQAPGFDKIKDSKLQAQLVDFGVTSGPAIAVQKLQEILHTKVDGILGPKTLAAIEAEDARYLANKLAASRIQMIGRIVQKNPSQLKWLSGWINRAISFIR